MRDKEIDALRISEAEERSHLTAFDGLYGDDVAAGVLLQKAGSITMLLSDPTRVGWRSQRDKKIDDLVSRFMSEILDTMVQADNATSFVFS